MSVYLQLSLSSITIGPGNFRLSLSTYSLDIHANITVHIPLLCLLVRIKVEISHSKLSTHAVRASISISELLADLYISISMYHIYFAFKILHISSYFVLSVNICSQPILPVRQTKNIYIYISAFDSFSA